MARAKKATCEGCGNNFHPAYLNPHRRECPQYIEWSKNLPHKCRKGCGMGFSAPRSRANHERVCPGFLEGKVKPCGICGARVTSQREHFSECPGPETLPEVDLDAEAPKDGCACGHVGHGPSHRINCAHWWVYNKSLPYKCKGCNRGFLTNNARRAHLIVCEPWQKLNRERWEEAHQVPCPSCGQKLSGTRIGLHKNACPGPYEDKDWKAWSEYMRRDPELYGEGASQGKDFVVCRICGKRLKSLSWHLTSQHGIASAQYQKVYPGAPTIRKKSLRLRKEAWLARYGAENLWEAGILPPPPKTGPEKILERLAGLLLTYTGDHAYWLTVREPDGTWKRRNPDFVAYSVEQRALIEQGMPPNEVRSSKVVEVLGNYWHREEATGMPPDQYVLAREAEYAGVRVASLFLWESELLQDPDGCLKRLLDFLGVVQEDSQEEGPSVFDLFGE